MSETWEADALKRVEEITTMFEEATGWGSWMVTAANERERLVNRLNATGRHNIEHKWLARTGDGMKRLNKSPEPPTDKIREARLETVAQFLVLLARENVPPHIQEVLCYGDTHFGVRPGALERALAALPSCRGWRPVSDAPKDGTEIIGAFFDIRWADSHRKHDVVRCWWQPEFNAFISSCREMTLAPGLTFEDGTRRNLHSPVIEPITHWMPLPSPPER